MSKRIRQLVAVAATALFASVAGASPDGWSRFRGPNGTGISDTSGLPVQFGPEQAVEWTIEVPFGRSSPVLSADPCWIKECRAN